jgi:hypothetical protein
MGRPVPRASVLVCSSQWFRFARKLETFRFAWQPDSVEHFCFCGGAVFVTVTFVVRFLGNGAFLSRWAWFWLRYMQSRRPRRALPYQ